MSRSAISCRFVATLVLLGACRPEVRAAPAPVCVLVREGALAEEEDYEEEPVSLRTMRWEEWVALLTDAGPGQRASRDCSGRSIRFVEEDACTRSSDSPTPRPIDEEAVVVSRVDGDERLVWVITHRFEGGDGLGPVAHVRLENDRAKVLALGQLRGRVGRARLREIGLGAGVLLLQEGETCAAPDDAESCHRSARLLPRVGRQYVPRSLRLPSGRCVGPGEVVLTDCLEVELRTGWRREFTRAASIDTEGSVVVVREQITASDRDPATPTVPPRPVRELNSDRTIRMGRDHRLVLSDPFHWQSLVGICGSTEAPHAAAGRTDPTREDMRRLSALCSERQRSSFGSER